MLLQVILWACGCGGLRWPRLGVENVAGATHPHGAPWEQQLNDLDRRAGSVVWQSFEGSPEAAAAELQLRSSNQSSF